jgi:hypothetical protein
MIRDIEVPPNQELYQPEPPLDFLEIPKPTFDTASEISEESKEEQEAYMPSLSDYCVKVLSENLSIDNALEMLESADM